MLEALGFIERQVGEAGWRWVAIGAGMALEGACVAALSAYETAEESHLLHPDHRSGQPLRIAPPQTLLRRVSSSDYLEDADRLRLGRAQQRQLTELLAVRNRAVHAGLEYGTTDFRAVAGMLPALITALRHLCVEQPAFAGARWQGARAGIGAALTRLETALSTAVR